MGKGDTDTHTDKGTAQSASESHFIFSNTNEALQGCHHVRLFGLQHLALLTKSLTSKPTALGWSVTALWLSGL